MKLNTLKIITLFILAGLLFQSCATILGGKSNTLVFSEKNLTPAKVFIDGELVGDAPGKIKLPKHKIQHGSVVVIKAEGYAEKEYLILRKQNTFYSVADLLIGGIPLAVDYTTGNIYRPVPRAFKYELIKE
jgi:hypothetical protein